MARQGRRRQGRPVIGQVAVVGGGAWGTALAVAAATAGCDTVLWMRDPALAAATERGRENARYLPGLRLPDRVRVTAAAGELGTADAHLLVMPAQAVRGVLSGLAAVLRSEAPAVICAKGIERGTGAYLSEVVAAVAPGRPVAVLSGPSFAADVARGLPTAVTLACRDGTIAAGLAAALSGPALRIYHGTDVRGVEIGGAAKNVLAVAAGIVEGRRLGESAKAALVARGFAELMRFATAAGGRPETLMGLSGLGDLVLTCASAQSRNFSLGLRIGAGAEPAQAAAGPLAEGAFTAEALIGLARAGGVEMPISEAVADLVAGRLTVERAIEALMARPLRSET